MAASPSILARDDTLLGACYAIGEDFGFNPLYLRLLFAFGVLWSPAIAFAAYAGLTALVALSRWMAPNPPSFVEEEAEMVGAEAPAERQVELPLAA